MCCSYLYYIAKSAKEHVKFQKNDIINTGLMQFMIHFRKFDGQTPRSYPKMVDKTV